MSSEPRTFLLAVAMPSPLHAARSARSAATRRQRQRRASGGASSTDARTQTRLSNPQLPRSADWVVPLLQDVPGAAGSAAHGALMRRGRRARSVRPASASGACDARRSRAAGIWHASMARLAVRERRCAREHRRAILLPPRRGRDACTAGRSQKREMGRRAELDLEPTSFDSGVLVV